jgi:hypothetical protein
LSAGVAPRTHGTLGAIESGRSVCANPVREALVSLAG